jgi:hypothetical protein
LKSINSSNTTALVCDPSLEEERLMDGRIIISMTAHQELCAIHKPGGIPISPEAILTATSLASERIRVLHASLQAALNELELRIAKENDLKLESYRAYREYQDKHKPIESSSASIGTTERESMNAGVKRDDPMLAWSNLHQPASLPIAS